MFVPKWFFDIFTPGALEHLGLCMNSRTLLFISFEEISYRAVSKSRLYNNLALSFVKEYLS